MRLRRRSIHARANSAGRNSACLYDHAVAMDLEDGALLAAARAGDVDAFAEIVRRYEHRLRPVLRRILDDSRDVDEAVQDVFVQAWRNLDRYRGDAAVFTWLYRIGVNEGLARRRRKRLETVELESPAAAAVHDERGAIQPERSAEMTDTGERVHAALAALPFDYREAVVLRDLAGLSNEEVADALGLTLPAAKSRIHRGRMQLRELLDPGLADY
jgi:RNA polymerase sigma-70 factor, ECF subfamily